MGLEDAVPDHGLNVAGVGGAKDATEVTCGTDAGASDGADPEVEDVILGAGLLVAVFRHRAFFFPDLDAQVAVHHVWQLFSFLRH